MKILKNILKAIIHLPYALLTLGWILLKLMIEYFYKLTHKKEILEVKLARKENQEKYNSIANHNELLNDENTSNVQMSNEINELLSKKYLLLGFYSFVEKTSWGTLGKKLTTYFVYQNQSHKKFFESSKSIINALRKADDWTNLMCEESEIFEISGHLPGQFSKYRANHDCTNVEIKTRATFIEGKYYFDKKLNRRKIEITNVLTSALSNNGMATQEFHFLKEIAKKNNFEKIYGEISNNCDIETRVKLRRFYTKNGFTIEIDRGDN